MWLMLLCVWLQQPSVQVGTEVDTTNAQIFLRSGERIEMINVRLRGINAGSFEIQTKENHQILSLASILRIKKIGNETGRFEVWLDNGDILKGKIRNVAFESDKTIGGTGAVYLMLYNLDRIHFISASPMRHCLTGHYEKNTPYPFCPICGAELQFGTYEDEEKKERYPNPQFHQWRLDPRNPTSGPVGGG
ncbi:hypothetical protein [Acanthopleuribacter pedis]|uniref:Uncharacterized protein n=1 Tax=Acanthopleuribacter pedis TaxID=442870 RepID=A0A8J7Q5A5_9BACT|nr:hypothetical protein [Acanthopleuribacter pedis]MBO1316894.1 hypothetical protein [Acanthopleuribacter pedis]